MAEPRIEIVIAAQAQQFKQELDAVQARLAKLEGAVSGTGQKIRKNFTKNTNQAQNALRDFSRVVQDAPFGIIGVGNNIQELAGSFGFLVRSSGGVKAAFAGLAGALSGPGGLILLVSAVTTVLTVLERRGGFTENKIKDLSDAVDGLNESFSRLQSIASLELDIAKLSGGDVELQTQNLIRLIEAQQFQNQEKIRELELVRDNIKAIRLQKTALGGLSELLKTGIQNVWSDIKRDVSTVAAIAIVGANELAKTLGIIEGLEGFDQPDKTVSEEEKELNDLITGQKEKQLEFTKKILELQKSLNKETKDTKDKGIDQGKLFGLLDTLDADAEFEKLSQGFADVFAEASKLPPIIPPDPSEFRLFWDSLSAIAEEGSFAVQQSFQKILDQEAWIQRLQEAKEDLNEGINELFVDTIAGGVSDLVGSVTSAIANGENVFAAAGQSLLKTFSKFLTQYGTQLITYGKLTVAKGNLDIAARAGGPFAVAAGLAAIKVGIAAAAAGAALGALANSGLFGAGGAGGVSATGGGSTSVQAPSFAPSEQVVVFEIAGEKLIGVLDNTYSRNNRLSGSTVRR